MVWNAMIGSSMTQRGLLVRFICFDAFSMQIPIFSNLIHYAIELRFHLFYNYLIRVRLLHKFHKLHVMILDSKSLYAIIFQPYTI